MKVSYKSKKLSADKFGSIGRRFRFEAPLLDAAFPAGKIPGVNNVGDLDLYKYLLPGNQDNFYLVRVNGESMIDINIFDGDILIVEECNTASPGDIVISSLNGELTVKRLIEKKGVYYLQSENSRFLPIEISPEMSFTIQGKVRHVVHSLI